jgi:hypothetical protein
VHVLHTAIVRIQCVGSRCSRWTVGNCEPHTVGVVASSSSLRQALVGLQVARCTGALHAPHVAHSTAEHCALDIRGPGSSAAWRRSGAQQFMRHLAGLTTFQVD